MNELAAYRLQFDERQLRGSELLRRCGRELVGDREYREHLLSTLREDILDKARILATAARSAAQPIQAGESGEEPAGDAQPVPPPQGHPRAKRLPPDQDPDFNRFYKVPLNGDLKLLAKALHAAGHSTTPNPKHLDTLVGSEDIALSGRGKTWRMFLRSRTQYENTQREVDRLKPARRPRS